ncbi:MAG: isopeptide-forming domain-containing fimbrial protein [Clostridium sp.]|uniref:isopeptide-forming domain-containing fimbrial protein n=1 Tax=Clostridium sp. TaxID=1506 RepID=UPI0025B7A8E9|nr:isopeptide-forming domain-containing fimbrial protein [Clostridium sp.]MCF0146795.1 isopeptide-forming domain-containing fimbrial protein [Clostridium sp.]
MASNILKLSIDNTQNIPIIIGNTSSFDVNISNLSSTQRLYNLGIKLNLPDGLILSSASIPQTSSITNADNSTTYSWVNIKDLAPLEVNYKFSITLRCNTKFKNGTTIPFGYNFSNITLSVQVDTMPRGIYDVGNEVIIENVNMSYIATRFSGTITTSGKVLKGAGYSTLLADYTQVNTATCKFNNNSNVSSLVNIRILLDDGIRFIGNVTTSGTDASKFTNPTISKVSINGKIYTELFYGNINLSISSNTTVIFSYAIWNNYNDNQGNNISHGTKLNMSVNLDSADPLVTANSYYSFTLTAMDLIITTSISRSTVDVQTNVTYTYIYKVGQYYNIQNIVVHYLLPDGIYYISSSPAPSSVVDNPTLKGFYLVYNFPLATTNSSRTVTISARVDSFYRYKLDDSGLNMPVVAGDSFIANTDILGTLVSTLNNVTDISNVSSSIAIATINKQFIKGYYKDGTPKNINTLAPGDLAEYTLTYNASNLKAIQKQIYIDDFFPLSVDPINNLNYLYTGINPLTPPQLISPHGVDFYYGDVLGLSLFTINFKAPIAFLGSSTENANLMKLKGINTDKYSYSGRSQVNFNIGTPNLTLTKSVSGPNKNAIQSNEVYSYTVTISNSNNLNTETDAFDFTVNDTLSALFTVNENSIRVSGSGSFNTPILQGNNISFYIKKLAPGNSLTLSYDVKITSVLSPGVNITTTATNTNPYSQVYNPNSTNFQYSNLNKSASITISSLAITLTKTNFPDIFKVGSLITYSLTATITKGTIAYGLFLRDNLPSGGQIYVGPSYRNNREITPTVSSNVVTFPQEGTVDARVNEQSINYIFTARISNANKSLNATTSTQSNTLQCIYTQVPGGSSITISKSLTVTINHPNLLMNLSVTDITTSVIYTQTANISTNSILQFKLNFQNNSAIKLLNGTIEIPIDSNFLFYKIDSTILCTAIYNSSLNKIIITIPQLSASQSGYILFTVVPKANLKSGVNITTQGTATSYYNDISTTKVYSGEKSNIITCLLQPGVSLKPNPLYAINESTSFIVTPPGNTANILNYFKNTGGGYDNFSLIIQKVAIPYSIYIDDIKIEDVPANTLYNKTLSQMTNLAPNTEKVIKLVTTIPVSSPLGTRYDFIVTAKSNTSPYPERTVTNIDPY